MYEPAHFDEEQCDESHRIIDPPGALVIKWPNGLDANHVPLGHRRLAD